MTYKVDEYLEQTLERLSLCPSVEIDLRFNADYKEDIIDVFIFWHEPSINVGYYPICQIDLGGKVIYHREGAENPEEWNRLLKGAAEFIRGYDFTKED